MKSNGTLPSGFTCDCGRDHKFPPYVYAHWDIQLTFKCDCGREYILLQGRVSQIVQAKGLVKK